MTSPPRRALVPVLVLLGLLGAAHVEHGLARLGVLWRQSVLSWDNPATQVLEELASQAVPHADGARLGVAGDPDGLPDAASCPCVSRAPPVA